MDKELQRYYEDRFSMMSTQGWADLIEDIQTMFESHNKINGINSPEEFWKRKGQIDMLQWILSLKEVSSQTYEELKNEETV